MAPAPKRRRTEPQAEEILFDPSARQEYLTGFHKRKQQRIQNARETTAKRDKEEKVRERKQMREQRKEDLERHVTEVNAELRKQDREIDGGSDAGSDEKGGEEEWEGFEGTATVEVLPDDEEYVDEDKYTTVTVEAMDGEEDGGQSDKNDGQGENVDWKPVEPVNGDAKSSAAAKKRIWSKDGQAKPKKKKFRYESKAERQVTRQKQKSKNHKAKLRRTGK